MKTFVVFAASLVQTNIRILSDGQESNLRGLNLYTPSVNTLSVAEHMQNCLTTNAEDFWKLVRWNTSIG